MNETGETFDAVATDYEAELAAGLDATGEGAAYFAQGRVNWLARRLSRLQFAPTRVLDFGCGVGGSVPFLLTLLGVESINGCDVSAASLAVARKRHTDPRVTFVETADALPAGSIDLAFCNGVFHHIPLSDRASAVASVYRALRPGGLFALWENNPWNPGVRHIMRRVSFDRDAITLSPIQTRRLLRSGRFDVVAPDFLFIFPSRLRVFRFLEPSLSRLPLGGQYLTLARKPAE